MNNISNVLTKLQGSISENLTNAAVNELEKRVLKLLSHDNKTNLQNSLKQNQDLKLPSLEQTMEIDIQLTDLRGNEKDMSNLCKICDRPHKLKMSNSSKDNLQRKIATENISKDNLQLRTSTKAVSKNGLIKAKLHICPQGTFR